MQSSMRELSSHNSARIVRLIPFPSRCRAGRTGRTLQPRASLSLSLSLSRCLSVSKSLIEYPRILKRRCACARACTCGSQARSRASANFARRIRTNAHRLAVVLCHRAWEDRGTSCLRHTLNFASACQSPAIRAVTAASSFPSSPSPLLMPPCELDFCSNERVLSTEWQLSRFRVIPNVCPQRQDVVSPS